jgi:hypothetical protein
MIPRRLLDWRKLLIYRYRWLGIAMGLIFLAWFVSGIFPMYGGMPHFSAAERLMRMQPLDVSSIHFTPEEAASYLKLESPARLRIAMIGTRPVYRILTREGWTTVWADNAEPLKAMNALHATNTLRYYEPEHAHTLRYDEYLTAPDQWTHQSAQRALMPLHRIALNDEAKTYYYISEQTGEPVMKTDSRARFRGWLSGALWLAPFQFLRGEPATNAQTEPISAGAINLKPVTLNRIREAVDEISKSFTPKELELFHFHGRPHFIAYKPPEEGTVFPQTSSSNAGEFQALRWNREHVIVPVLKP